MPYLVQARPRPQWPGRWRSGRFFSSTEPTLLQDHELTDAMREDPVLVIEALTEDPPAEEPGTDTLVLEADGQALAINDPADVQAPIRCTATSKNGKPCKSWALEGSDRCRMHPHE